MLGTADQRTSGGGCLPACAGGTLLLMNPLLCEESCCRGQGPAGTVHPFKGEVSSPLRDNIWQAKDCRAAHLRRRLLVSLCWRRRLPGAALRKHAVGDGVQLAQALVVGGRCGDSRSAHTRLAPPPMSQSASIGTPLPQQLPSGPPSLPSAHRMIFITTKHTLLGLDHH